MAISIFLLIVYTSFIGLVLKKTFEGDAYYLLLYILFLLPFYTSFQMAIFKGFELVPLVNMLKYSKDFVFFTGFFVFVFGAKQSFVTREWQLTFLDKLILGFTLLTIVYMLWPLGAATFLSKIIYAKNMFLLSIIYFLGRHTIIDAQRWHFIVKTVIFLTLFAFVLALAEKTGGFNIQRVLGYANYNLRVNDIAPTGSSGLSWTFEREGGLPRFAAFFANPLEFAASSLLFLSVALYYFFHSGFSRNRFAYLGLLGLIALSFLFSYSRGAMIAGVFLIFFSLFLEKRYRLLGTVFVLFVSVILYVIFFASKETQYFILDTLNFQNSSSLGHLLEWYQGVNSMIQNPMGIGLAMSGNANGVDQSIKIGGENQFLIYGVQMGIIGLLLYGSILFRGIKDSIKVFKKSNQQHIKSIAYIAAATKIGMLIPLFTANAELYLFVALFSWFLIGNTQTNKIKGHNILD